jgi:glucosamine--fructose-6-phosphate aminotransferase (isomerizing)
MEIRRAKGKLRNLEEAIPANTARRHLRYRPHTLGNTRTAHRENAHPHRDCTGRVVVVHNGIIENYLNSKIASARRIMSLSQKLTPK